MKTSRKTDYALHALMILAKRKKEIDVVRLAQLQNVSDSYLAKVMQKLSRAGIVSSSEGKGGGYSLSKSPDNISLASVVETLEGNKIFTCVDDIRGCEIRERCKIHQKFEEAYNVMLKELKNSSVADILEPEIENN